MEVVVGQTARNEAGAAAAAVGDTGVAAEEKVDPEIDAADEDDEHGAAAVALELVEKRKERAEEEEGDLSTDQTPSVLLAAAAAAADAEEEEEEGTKIVVDSGPWEVDPSLIETPIWRKGREEEEGEGRR